MNENHQKPKLSAVEIDRIMRALTEAIGEAPAAPTDTNPEPRIMDKEEISTSLTDVDNFATGYNQTAKANELPKPD